jgi:16S rRNA (guanine(966)-N(2))-methyltransferase RsmD
MRITGGISRGIQLAVPPGLQVRPTRDAVRQALFNILGGWVAGKRVLDLYAGSGSLGLEALSRGAEQAVFVEKDRTALRCLEMNLKNSRLKASACVEPTDVFRFLESVRAGTIRGEFQGVFADPPFAYSNSAELEGLVQGMQDAKLWGRGDLVCMIEVESTSKWAHILQKLPGLVEFRKYGRNLLAIARRPVE